MKQSKLFYLNLKTDMDLKLKDKTFLVCGATSGFGLATAKKLLEDGAKVHVVARDERKLQKLQSEYPELVSYTVGDLSVLETIDKLISDLNNKELHGALINAGGPPAKSFLETEIPDWDDAYNKLLRWKVYITQKLIPLFEKRHYGRIVYIESSSVKQPIENLALSNSLRLAVVGFVKTLSQEIAHKGITLNILAPGSHETPAIERLINKMAENEGTGYNEAKEKWVDNIKVGRMGKADELGSLAAWLLSPLSGFVTGQTYTLDGGVVKGTL